MAPSNDETILPLLSGHAHRTWNLRTTFSAPLTIITAAIFGVFIAYVRYPELESTDAHVNQYYMYYIHVAIMIFIGFGCAATLCNGHLTCVMQW